MGRWRQNRHNYGYNANVHSVDSQRNDQNVNPSDLGYGNVTNDIYVDPGTSRTSIANTDCNVTWKESKSGGFHKKYKYRGKYNSKRNNSNYNNVIWNWKDRNDLFQYLRKYREICVRIHDQFCGAVECEMASETTKTAQNFDEGKSAENLITQQRLTGKEVLKETLHIQIAGHQFTPMPNYDDENDIIQMTLLLLEKPFWKLPSSLSSKERKIVHECCTELGIFHETIAAPELEAPDVSGISENIAMTSNDPTIDVEARRSNMLDNNANITATNMSMVQKSQKCCIVVSIFSDGFDTLKVEIMSHKLQNTQWYEQRQQQQLSQDGKLVDDLMVDITSSTNSVQLYLYKPWFYRVSEHERKDLERFGQKLIDGYIDQPSYCIREGNIDEFDYFKVEGFSLNAIEPPRFSSAPLVGDTNPTGNALNVAEMRVLEREDISKSSTLTICSTNDDWMLVDSVEKMMQCIDELTNGPVQVTELAFDLESYSVSKYAQLTCLLQITSNLGKHYVIDPLAKSGSYSSSSNSCDDTDNINGDVASVASVWDAISGLRPLFMDGSIVKIGHSVGSLDCRSLFRDFGIIVVNLFDTYEAAQVLQLPKLGLVSVCEYYGCASKHIQDYRQLKDTYQKCDWTVRPLSHEMIQYGRFDINYLLPLRRLMIRDLTHSKHFHNHLPMLLTTTTKEDYIKTDTNGHLDDHDDCEHFENECDESTQSENEKDVFDNGEGIDCKSDSSVLTPGHQVELIRSFDRTVSSSSMTPPPSSSNTIHPTTTETIRNDENEKKLFDDLQTSCKNSCELKLKKGDESENSKMTPRELDTYQTPLKENNFHDCSHNQTGAKSLSPTVAASLSSEDGHFLTPFSSIHDANFPVTPSGAIYTPTISPDNLSIVEAGRDTTTFVDITYLGDFIHVDDEADEELTAWESPPRQLAPIKEQSHNEKDNIENGSNMPYSVPKTTFSQEISDGGSNIKSPIVSSIPSSLASSSQLRLEPRLMTVLSKSQERCKTLSSCTKTELFSKNSYFLSMMKRSKLASHRFNHKRSTNNDSNDEVRKWVTNNSNQLFHDLANWRDSVSLTVFQCSPGFLMSLDFLVNVAWKQPTTTTLLRRIQYKLPEFLENESIYRDALLQIVAEFRDKVKKEHSFFNETGVISDRDYDEAEYWYFRLKKAITTEAEYQALIKKGRNMTSTKEMSQKSTKTSSQKHSLSSTVSASVDINNQSKSFPSTWAYIATGAVTVAFATVIVLVTQQHRKRR